MASPNELPFIIEDSASPEQLELIHSFAGLADSAPEAMKEGLAVYREDPEAVGRVVSLLEANPEAGMAVLSTLSSLLTTGADRLISFDADTEKAIVARADFKEQKALQARKGEEAENAVSRMRLIRLSVTLGRLAA